MSVLLIALALFNTGCDRCRQSASDDPFAAARCRIREMMERKSIASLQVAVAKDGALIYEEAFGVANRERQTPTTIETMHLVASIEKPFVSTALMILSERGAIDLGGPVNDYIGKAKLVAFRGNAEQATIARLLLHTTGLPYGYYIAGDEIPLDSKRTDNELVGLAGVLVTAPGTRYQYTNIGYGLFGEIVRRATGENLKEFITREVILPLGLEHTRFFHDQPPAESIATQNVGGGVLPVVYDADGYSALYSTAGDLARFGMFHLKAHLAYQRPILIDSSIDMLWKYKDSSVAVTTRRLAWDEQHDYGLRTIQHGGGGPGIHNWLYLIPSENTVIALMSNAQYGSSDPVLVELIAAAIRESKGTQFSRRAGRGWPKWPRLDPSEFHGEWEGVIKGPKGECSVEVAFDRSGIPKLYVEGDGCSAARWVSATGKVKTDYGSLLWRFDTCIPYLYPHAEHDEVILTIWPDGSKLIGSASAAKEKNFGHGENYVLPQYIELAKSREH